MGTLCSSRCTTSMTSGYSSSVRLRPLAKKAAGDLVEGACADTLRRLELQPLREVLGDQGVEVLRPAFRAGDLEQLGSDDGHERAIADEPDQLRPETVFLGSAEKVGHGFAYFHYCDRNIVVAKEPSTTIPERVDGSGRQWSN